MSLPVLLKPHHWKHMNSLSWLWIAYFSSFQQNFNQKRLDFSNERGVPLKSFQQGMLWESFFSAWNPVEKLVLLIGNDYCKKDVRISVCTLSNTSTTSCASNGKKGFLDSHAHHFGLVALVRLTDSMLEIVYLRVVLECPGYISHEWRMLHFLLLLPSCCLIYWWLKTCWGRTNTFVFPQIWINMDQLWKRGTGFRNLYIECLKTGSNSCDLMSCLVTEVLRLLGCCKWLRDLVKFWPKLGHSQWSAFNIIFCIT